MKFDWKFPPTPANKLEVAEFLESFAGADLDAKISSFRSAETYSAWAF